MIFHGDCLDIMPALKEESADLFLTDLPFGTTQSPWDSVIPYTPLWSNIERLIKKNGCIVLFAKSPFDKALASSNMKLYKYEWIWEKNKASGHLNTSIMPMQAHENILVFYKSPPTYNPQMTDGHKPMNYAMTHHTSSVYGDGKSIANQAGSTERHPRSVLYFPVVNNDDSERCHPNQKPVPLLEYLIKTYTNKGDRVIDCTAGSGSVGVACMNTKREFVLIEKEKEYFDHCVRRTTTDYKQQLNLF